MTKRQSWGRWGIGRKKPYTQHGIKRMPCIRCGQKSMFQWNICADDNNFRPVCRVCDVLLNALVLQWTRHPQAMQKAMSYAKEKCVTNAQLLAGLKQGATNDNRE